MVQSDPIIQQLRNVTYNAPISQTGGNLYLATGSLGIGTNYMNGKLNLSNGINQTTKIVLGPSTSATSLNYCSMIESVNTGSSNYSSSLNFYTHSSVSNNSSVLRMTINDSGNVGIGTSIPSVPLEVNGTIKGSYFTGPSAAFTNLVSTVFTGTNSSLQYLITTTHTGTNAIITNLTGTNAILANLTGTNAYIQTINTNTINTLSGSSLSIGNDSNTSTLNLGCGSNTQTVNIGTNAGTTTINIGGAGDTVNIAGTLSYVQTTNTRVSDSLITLNKGGAVSSATNSGIEIEENGTITGYMKTSSDRNSIQMKAPNSATVMSINQSLLTTDTVQFGKIGLGTASPTYSMDINGHMGLYNGSTIYAKNSAGTYEVFCHPRWTNDVTYINMGSAGFKLRTSDGVSDLITVGSTGYIGFSTFPVAPLHVVCPGNAHVRVESVTNPGYGFKTTVSSVVRYASITLKSGASDKALQFYNESTSGSEVSYNFLNGTAGSIVSILNSGNVGIGVATPSYKLDVSGTCRIAGTSGYGNSLAVTGDVSTNRGDGTAAYYFGDGARYLYYDATNYILAGGGKFTVNNGNIYSSNLMLQGDGTNAYIRPTNASSNLYLGSNNTNYLTILSGGNVGIGTTSPSTLLQTSSSPAGLLEGIKIVNTNRNYGSNAGLGLYISTDAQAGGTGVAAARALIQAQCNPAGSKNVLALGISPLESSTVSQTLNIISDGNVGIGTTSPTDKLHVTGSLLLADSLGQGWIKGWDEHHSIVFREAAGNTMTFYEYGDIRFMTNGLKSSQTEKMRITAGGNVGIGNSSPDNKLDVNGTIRSWASGNGGISMHAGSANNPGYMEFFNPSSTRVGYIGWQNTSGYLCLQTEGGYSGYEVSNNLLVDGKIGVGMQSPGAPIQVAATSNTSPATNAIYVYNPTASANNNAIVTMRVNGASAGNPFTSWDINGVTGWSMGIDNADSDKLKISNDWASLSLQTKMTIQTNGNIGIGTTAPDSKLHLFNSTTGNTTETLFKVQFDGNWDLRLDQHHISGSRVNYYLRTKWSNTVYEGISFDSANIGIGLQYPSTKLHVNGNIGFPYGNAIVVSPGTSWPSGTNNLITVGWDQNGMSGDVVSMYTPGSQSAAPRIVYSGYGYIKLNGNVGIGTNGPAYPLRITNYASNANGNFSYSYLAYHDLSAANSWDGGGITNISIFCAGRVIATEFDAYSDSRIKKNIVSITDSTSLDVINQIDIVSYNYIDSLAKGTGTVTGFIAQQVKDVYPTAVTLNKEFIPNIYKLCEVSFMQNTGTVYTYHITNNIESFENATRIKYISAEKIGEANVIDITTTHVQIETDEEINIYNNQVFVFGKQIDDFHILDKDKIFALNVSATQELYRKIVQQQTQIDSILSILQRNNIS